MGARRRPGTSPGTASLRGDFERAQISLDFDGVAHGGPLLLLLSRTVSSGATAARASSALGSQTASAPLSDGQLVNRRSTPGPLDRVAS